MKNKLKTSVLLKSATHSFLHILAKKMLLLPQNCHSVTPSPPEKSNISFPKFYLWYITRCQVASPNWSTESWDRLQIPWINTLATQKISCHHFSSPASATLLARYQELHHWSRRDSLQIWKSKVMDKVVKKGRLNPLLQSARFKRRGCLWREEWWGREGNSPYR